MALIFFVGKTCFSIETCFNTERHKYATNMFHTCFFKKIQLKQSLKKRILRLGIVYVIDKVTDISSLYYVYRINAIILQKF